MNFGYAQMVPTHDRFLDPMTAARLDELDAHDGVVVEEAAWIGAVGADASDDRGEMDDDLWAVLLEQTFDVRSGSEIVVFAPGHKDVIAALFSQLFDEVRAEESGAAGHDQMLLPQVHSL